MCLKCPACQVVVKKGSGASWEAEGEDVVGVYY